jgi:hypothetical protein
MSIPTRYILTPQCRGDQKMKIASGWDDALEIATMVKDSINWESSPELEPLGTVEYIHDY